MSFSFVKVSIEGNIGSGKTTLLEYFNKHSHVEVSSIAYLRKIIGGGGGGGGGLAENLPVICQIDVFDVTLGVYPTPGRLKVGLTTVGIEPAQKDIYLPHCKAVSSWKPNSVAQSSGCCIRITGLEVV
jgi:ABC-type cobalamin/Fe3+-siderophores transport system ATPase subunit